MFAEKMDWNFLSRINKPLEKVMRNIFCFVGVVGLFIGSHK